MDFQLNNFRIDDNVFEVDQPELKGRCRVTFYTLPPDIQEVKDSRGTDEARKVLRTKILSRGTEMEFLDLWKSGGWCFKFPQGII